jgi:hypothetical protein
MNQITMPLERLEAVLAQMDGKKALVRVRILGGIELNFFGSIVSQVDSDDDPQFLVVYDKAPGCTLLFRAEDVHNIVYGSSEIDKEMPSIWLKRLVDIAQEKV